MADWTAPAFLGALKTQLEARAGIAAFTSPKVRVLDYFPGMDEALTDAIVLGHTISDTQAPAAMNPNPNRYQEDVEIQCEIRIVRPGAGSVPAATARVRAADLLGEIHNELSTNRPNVGDQTIASYITNRTMSQFPYQAGETPVRVCLIEFTVLYRSRTSSS